MNIYILKTKEGTYLSIGESEQNAKDNFTASFPTQNIMEIKQLNEKSVHLSHEDELYTLLTADKVCPECQCRLSEDEIRDCQGVCYQCFYNA